MTYANLVSGRTFYRNLNRSAIKFMVSQTSAPSGTTAYDISVEGDNSIIYWYDESTKIQYIYTTADKIYMNSNCSNMFYGSNLESIDLSIFDTSKVTTMASMFESCKKLKSIDLSNFNTSKVISMYNMFQYCSSLASLDLSSFDTSKVTDMSYMFCGCTSLVSLDLSGFNTSNVTDMSDMFTSCTALNNLNISSFDTSNVVTMYGMFESCKKLESINLSSFDTSNVTAMQNMFKECAFASLDISNFNMQNVENISKMFYYCSTLSELKTPTILAEKIENMEHVFYECSNIETLDLRFLRGQKCISTNSMFYNCTKLKRVDLSELNTAKNYITSYDHMFYNCTSLEFVDISKLITECYSSNNDVDGTPCGIEMVQCDSMFYNTHAQVIYGELFEPVITDNLDFSYFRIPNKFNSYTNPYPTKNMFLDSTSTKPNWKGQWRDDGSYTEYALLKPGVEINSVLNKNAKIVQPFINTNSYNPPTPAAGVDVHIISTSDSPWEVKTWYDETNSTQYILTERCLVMANDDMSYTFSGMINLDKISNIFSDIEFFDCKNISYFFSGCGALTEYSFRMQDAQFASVTDMSYMFKDCISLTNVEFNGDIDNYQNFTTPKVENLSGIFYNCINLVSVYATPWESPKELKNVSHMFENCKNLKRAEWWWLSYSSSNATITNMEYMFSGCEALADVDLIKDINTINVVDMSGLFKNCSSLTSIPYLNNNQSSSKSYFIEGEVLYSIEYEPNTNNKTYQMFYNCPAEKNKIQDGFYWTDDGTLLRTDLREAIITNFREHLLQEVRTIAFCHAYEDASMKWIMERSDSIEIQDITSKNKIYLYYDELYNKYSIYTRAQDIIFRSMNGLFSNLPQLEKITFSYKIDISNVTDMQDLFSNCPLLQTISYTDRFELPDAIRSTCINDANSNGTFKMFNNSPTANKPEWTGGYWSANGTFVTGEPPLEPSIRMSSRIYINGKDHIACKYSTTNNSEDINSINQINIAGDKVWSIYRKLSAIAQFASYPFLFGNVYGDRSNMTKFIRSDTLPSPSMKVVDASQEQNGSIISWYDADTTTQYWYSDSANVYLNEDSSNMFSNCKLLEVVDLANVDSSKATDMSSMFYGCASLSSLNISSFDTSNVTDMSSMFSGCTALKEIDLSHFNISKISGGQYISGMFSKAGIEKLTWHNVDLTNVGSGIWSGTTVKILDITGAKFHQYTSGTFGSIGSYIEEVIIANVDFSAASSLTALFAGCTKLKRVDLIGANISTITNMTAMFNGCTSLTDIDLSDLDCSNVTNMSVMFAGCTALKTINTSGWNTSSLTTIDNIFNSTAITTLDISHWDASSISSLEFGSMSELLSLDIHGWNLAKIDNAGITSFAISKYPKIKHIDMHDVSIPLVTSFDRFTAGGVSASNLFSGSKTLETIDLSGLQIPKVVGIESLFLYCESLISANLANVYAPLNTSINGLLQNCSSLSSIRFDGWDTSNVTNMGNLALGCSSLVSIDMSSFNTSNVTNMSAMFNGCTSLKEIDLSHFDFSGINTSTDVGGMFSGSGLEKLTMHNIDLSKIGYTIWAGTSYIKYIDISGAKLPSYIGGLFSPIGQTIEELVLDDIDISLSTSASTMFINCSKLKNISIKRLDTSKITIMSAMFLGCESLSSIDISSFNTSSVTDMSSMFNACTSLSNIIYGDTFILPDTIYEKCIDTSGDNKTVRMFNDCPTNKPTGGNWNLGTWNDTGTFIKS